MMLPVTAFALLENTVISSTSGFLSALRVEDPKLLSDWVPAVLINFSKSKEILHRKKSNVQNICFFKDDMKCAEYYIALQLEFIPNALQGLVYTRKSVSVYLDQYRYTIYTFCTKSTYLWKECPVNRIYKTHSLSQQLLVCGFFFIFRWKYRWF